MLNEKELKKTSKFLSLILRHRPELIGIEMDKQGWVNVKELINKSKTKGASFDLETLQFIVDNNNKKRFAFNEDGSKIRASQGHSVEIDLAYEPIQPPEELFHGTAERFMNSILKEGLKKRNRHHVHLSAILETAEQVGARHGRLVVLKVDSGEMYKEGYAFYKSENDVWLTDHVPVRFLRQ